MKIAVPVSDGALSLHFGHCDTFALYEINEADKSIAGSQTVSPPPHAPGVLPKWLHEQGATVIIAGGMGMRAQQLFQQADISVVIGATAAAPEVLVEQWLAGTLATGENVCDH